MLRGTLMPATIAVVIAVAIGAGARAQELSCPPGYAPDQGNTSCVPAQPSGGPSQGDVAGQAKQLLNSLGAAVQGAPSKAAGALGGVLNSFGLGGSDAAPKGDNGGTAQGGVGGGVAQGGVGGGAASAPCGFGEYPPCKLAEDACALLAPDVVAAVLGGGWTRKGSGPMRPLAGAALVNDCTYDGPALDDEVTLTVHDGGRAQFHRAVYNMGRGVTALSGVGDAAYESRISRGSNDEGKAIAQVQVWVIKGGTYFDITVNRESPNLAPGPAGVALASKVADRISLGLGGSGAAPRIARGGVVGGATNGDYGGQRPLGKTAAQGACALLTAKDIATILGDSVTWSSAAADTTDRCSYSTTGHADVDLNLAGGRAEFHKLPSELPGMTTLSGVGDAAYNGPKSTGGSGAGAQVFVLKGNTYFYITVQSERGDASDARSAVALARKVADRI
jgi:hypothetical protein